MSDELLQELKSIAARQKFSAPEGVSMPLSEADVSRVVEMGWEDRTPFEAIESGYGLNEAQVIELMRREMKPSSFKLWRQRVTGRKTKHGALRPDNVIRAYCPSQYKRG